MADLFSEVSKFDNSLTDKVKEYSGIIGLPTSNKTVAVPNRNGYVYVRLRDNTSEIIQAYNEEVSPVHGLPVIVVRQGGGWRIKGRDIERYNDWGSASAFLPEHAPQHEFNPASPGGDIAFIYPQQITPLLFTPSGTNGGPNIVMQQYSYKKGNTWLLAGITGTQSFLIYRPTDNTATIGMAYFDKTSGNPGILINSGSSVAENITGTHELLQYLPAVSNDYEPAAMVRLVSGTTSIEWDNLYDIRQFFGGSVTGTSGGGGVEEAPVDGLVYGRKDAGWVEVSGTAGGAGTPAGSDTEVQYNESGAFGADYRYHYDYNNNVLVLGSGTPPVAAQDALQIMKDQGSPGIGMWAWQSNSSVAPFIVGFRAAGTRAVPQAIDNDYDLFRMRARGYNGINWTSTQAEVLMNAPFPWVSGSHPTEISIWTTPSGTAVMEQVIEFGEYGANLSVNKTYNINGSPHQHTSVQLVTTHGQNTQVPSPSGTTQYLLPYDMTNGLRPSVSSIEVPACTVKNLSIKNGATGQPASGSIVCSIFKNGVATGLSVTFTSADGSGNVVKQDTSTEVSFSAGDSLSFGFENQATSSSMTIRSCSVELHIPTT